MRRFFRYLLNKWSVSRNGGKVEKVGVWGYGDLDRRECDVISPITIIIIIIITTISYNVGKNRKKSLKNIIKNPQI